MGCRPTPISMTPSSASPMITSCPSWPQTTCTSPHLTASPGSRPGGRTRPQQPVGYGRLAVRTWRPSAVRGGDGADLRALSGVVARTVEIADQCAFNLRLAKPRLPKLNVPAGETPISWLRALRQGADERYAHIREEAEERLRKNWQ